MTSWQQRARVGVVVFGVACAALVYWSIGDRRAVDEPVEVERFDPDAVAESTVSALRQDRGLEQEFSISGTRTFTYEDGSVRFLGVTIRVPKADGREFVITAREATAGAGEAEYQVSGGVVLVASDGFRLETDRALFHRDTAVARAPGLVRFTKGRLEGSGVEATYNDRDDVLYIARDAAIRMTDEVGRLTLDATAAAGTLDRVSHVLILDGNVRLLRDGQVIRSDRATAQLSPEEDAVTHTALRGGSRVDGGAGSITVMAADDIDLDYSDDGDVLEHVTLIHGASVRLAGSDGEPGAAMGAETLDLALTPGGAIETLTGRDYVEVTFPNEGAGPAGLIRSDLLDATGEPGRGLTSVVFRRDVEYVEALREGASRRVTARMLTLTLVDGAVSEAAFADGTTFEEKGLEAGAQTARYRPSVGRLYLGSSDASSTARVDAEQVHVDARAIEIALDGHGLRADGDVRTSLSALTIGEPEIGTRAPQLLRGGESVNVNADRFEYDPDTAQAVYVRATLWQGESALRGERVTINRRTGDLQAVGDARSTLLLDGARSDGRGGEIRYDQAARTLTYSSAVFPPTTGAGQSTTTLAHLARLSGSQGNLQAGRITVFLSDADNDVHRLESHASVRLDLGPRSAAGTHLTYYAADERYVMEGAPTTIRESCRETTGQTVTFYASTDRMIVDGNERGRTGTRPCTVPSK